MVGNTYNVGRPPWNKGKLGWKKGKLRGLSPNCIICGNQFLTYPSRIKNGMGKCCGLACAKILRAQNSPKGPAHYLWISDRTQLSKVGEERNSSAYQEWSRSVKIRDNKKCKISNKDCDGRLESHHILSWKDYPELRYEVNNGITLCHYHHPRKRDEEKRLSPYFQELVIALK